MISFKIINEERVNIGKQTVADLIDPDLQEIIKQIQSFGFDIRIVGGAVRDFVLGKTPRDVDLITDALPSEIIYMLSLMGIESDPWGIKHGTIKAIVNDEKYEITSLDYQIKQKGEEIEIIRSGDWKQDAQRRDFTINALSLDLEGNVYDYFQGLKHLQEQRLKPLPNFEEKIKETPVLILRFFRFLGKFDHPVVSKKDFASVINNVSLVSQIKNSRVQKEIESIYRTKNAQAVFDLMCKYNVFEYLDMDCISI